MEAARKTARDHISRYPPFRIPSYNLPSPFCFRRVIFIHVASARRENKYSDDTTRKENTKGSNASIFLSQRRYWVIPFFSFLSFLPSLFFLLFRFNFVLPYPFFVLCFVPVLSFFFFFSFFLERL